MDGKEELDSRLLAVAAKIKKLRIAKGYSSYENFAFDHGLSRVSYGRHEKGTNITMGSLLRILDIHQVSLKDFFSDLEG
jgi:hypothetical protein